LGIPIETVSRMMGHTSITTTQIYAEVKSRKVDEDTKALREMSAKRPVNLYEEEVIAKPKRKRKTV
jgi:integrase